MKRLSFLVNSICLALLLSQVQPVLADITIASKPAVAKRGDRVTVSIKTTPTAKCSLEALGNGLPQFMDLSPKVADSSGLASWTFDVSKYYKADKLPLLISCNDGAKTEKMASAIDIDSEFAKLKEPVLHLVAAPSSATRGEEITIKVHSTPGAELEIAANDAGMMQAFKLMEKKADKNGFAEWKFNVAKGFNANRMPVVITSELNGTEKKLVTQIEIGKKIAGSALPPLF